MKKIIGLAGVVLAFAVGAQAEMVVVDFTAPPGTGSNPDVGPGIDVSSNPIYDNYSFGDGRSADISITTAGTSLGSISVGIGANGGTQGGRIGMDEDLTISFSDFQGGLTAGDIKFVGLVASSESSGATAWIFGDLDAMSVNGTTLTGTAAGDGAHTPALTYGSAKYDYIYQDADSSVALNGSDALLLDLTTDAGIGYRLQAVRLDVVPEPATMGMVAVFGGAILFIRRRVTM